ncbi:MAG TPA: glycosyltransferase, partial [Gemmataceae bacterium]|nr:glycosyltransferase [Gemmataceae bacterium]
MSQQGVEVLDINLKALRESPAHWFDTLNRFRPDFLTAGNWNYLLVAAVAEPRLLRVPFPIAALWDDPLGAMVNHCMYRPEVWEEAEAEAAPKGVVYRVKACLNGLRAWVDQRPNGNGDRLAAPAVFRRLTDHPDLHHFAWDTGHMDAFRRLGLAPAKRLHWRPVATYAPFLETGAVAETIPQTIDVAFCGNVYLASLQKSPYWQDPFFHDLAQRIADRRVRELHRSSWELLLEETDRLPEKVRRAHQLTTDRKEFWTFYIFAVWQAANTLVRLQVLGGVRRPVHLFGMFADPETVQQLDRYPNLHYQRNCDHFTELPRTFASVKVNICLTNSLIIQGTPSKLIDCLASGGFALCEPKQDLVRLFGPRVEKIFFHSVEELNAKIDYYLAHAEERRALVEEFRETIARECTTRRLF